jgi:glycosyltransferase involved in cell wall biosynthesis
MHSLTLAICARNAEDIIGDCLASIEQQTQRPDALIVALDELSDPTAEVAERFGARVIASNATGLYQARNAVLRACDTDYLAFTDADCILVPEWVAICRGVLETQSEVAAVIGRHPPVGVRNFASWLHHMWYVAETKSTGDVAHVIGGNSAFRTEALREVGGWLDLPGHSAAEDMYISEALTRAGHRIWFEEDAAAQHHYETRLGGLWRKSVMMGRDIVVMLKAAGWYESLWWYTLSIPVLAVSPLIGIAILAAGFPWGAIVVAAPLASSLLFLAIRFRSVSRALPRWAARWILIWPYSLGILQGLLRRLPPCLLEYENARKNRGGAH